jgi:hypothetical protein
MRATWSGGVAEFVVAVIARPERLRPAVQRSP